MRLWRLDCVSYAADALCWMAWLPKREGWPGMAMAVCVEGQKVDPTRLDFIKFYYFSSLSL